MTKTGREHHGTEQIIVNDISNLESFNLTYDDAEPVVYSKTKISSISTWEDDNKNRENGITQIPLKKVMIL